MGSSGQQGVLLEIQTALANALARRGVAGELRVTAGYATLAAESSTSSVPLKNLVDRWHVLDQQQRQARIQRLSLELGGPRPPAQRRRFSWAALLILLVGSAYIGSQLVMGIVRGPNARGSDAAGAHTESTRMARARRVCEATESRVMRGGTVGAADQEGWVLELALLRPAPSGSLSELPEAAPLIQVTPGAAAVTWENIPALVRAETDATAVLTEHQVEGRHLSLLTLGGAYVRSYFREQERIHWLRYARKLAELSRAASAALYARCAHRDAHHVGTWFLGESPGGAAAALLYFVGAFQDAPVFNPELMRAKEQSRLLDELAAHTKNLTKQQLSTWLADDGGMVQVGGVGGLVAISFPYKDSNRAARASRRFARDLELSPGPAHAEGTNQGANALRVKAAGGTSPLPP